MSEVVWQTSLPGLPAPKRGKVRDIYDLGDELLIVACDRISAYDHVLHPGIPGKGKILSQLTNFWFERFRRSRAEPPARDRGGRLPAGAVAPPGASSQGRSVLVRKAEVVPFECVARGYLAGSGFREYTADGEVCGDRPAAGPANAPTGCRSPSSPRRPRPSRGTTRTSTSTPCASRPARRLSAAGCGSSTLDLYRRAARSIAAARGMLLADTKFEFGSRRRDHPHRRGPDPRLLALLGRRAAGSRASSPSPSTSSTFATGSTIAAGTTNRRRRSCPPTW